MPNWTPEEYRAYEAKTRRGLSSPQPEPPVRTEPLEESQGTQESSGRIVVRITSYRATLCDPDNLCVKALVDSLRYAGLIPDDRPQDIELVVRQFQCERKDERTEIELD